MAAARIAFVVDGAIEQRTGGYLYDRLVAEGLRARGDDVAIVSLPTDLFRCAEAHRRVGEALARDDLDAVIIDELCHPRATLAAIGSRLERSRRWPRLVTLVHHLTATERIGPARWVRLAIELALLAASDRVVVTSETTREHLASLRVARGRVFVAAPGRDRLGDAEAPALPVDATRFLFLGALTVRTRPLRALIAFRAAGGDGRLRFVGPTDRDPSCADRLRRSIERHRLDGRVEISGEVGDERVRQALRESDVLLMPSSYEGYGIAAAEAQAHGLLVIAYRVGALPEVVREGEGAVLVDPDDDDAFARAVARAASDRPWLDEQKARALAHGRSLPRWSDTVAAFRAAMLD